MSEKMSVYRVKAGADWLPCEATLDCERPMSVVDKFQYPQVYRDDIPNDHDDWETRYEGRLHELIGKPVELYVVAVDELGAFVRAKQLIAEAKQ